MSWLGTCVMIKKKKKKLCIIHKRISIHTSFYTIHTPFCISALEFNILPKCVHMFLYLVMIGLVDFEGFREVEAEDQGLGVVLFQCTR